MLSAGRTRRLGRRIILCVFSIAGREYKKGRGEEIYRGGGGVYITPESLW